MFICAKKNAFFCHGGNVCFLSYVHIRKWEEDTPVMHELIPSFPCCVFQVWYIVRRQMCGGLGRILVVWSQCSSKHDQRRGKKPQNKQRVSHSSTLRENNKWSRLRYHPAFTTPTVWGNLYDESWKGYFFPSLLPLNPLSLSFLSPHFLMLSLMNSSVLPSTSSILCLFFNIHNSILFRREPGSIYGNDC